MSASFNVFGDFASMAAFTAAMNAFLSNEPGRWASIESALAALACDPTSPDGGTAASWASLAFAVAGGCARFSRPVALTLPVTAVNAGSASGRTPLGGTGGCSRASSARARRRPLRPLPPRAAEPAFPRPAPVEGPTGAAFFAPARPSGLTAGTFFGGGTAFLAGTLPGPNPVVVTASAEAGGRIPSRSTGTPTDLRRLQPLLHHIRGRLVAPKLAQCPVDVGDGLLAGEPHPAGDQGIPRRIPAAALHRKHRIRIIPGPGEIDSADFGGPDAFERAATRPATAALPALRCNMAIDRGLINAAERRTAGA